MLGKETVWGTKDSSNEIKNESSKVSLRDPDKFAAVQGLLAWVLSSLFGCVFKLRFPTAERLNLSGKQIYSRWKTV